ncbi:MAG: helix-turn-helix domain-containing protein [Myxococcales bacterium]|nr:helix-turn-helix domain-containing protein [Myxococcales bacterium]
MPELLRVPHLAAALGLSENAIRDLLARGELPASKVGRRWVVRRDALLDHLAQQERLRQPRCSVESVVAAIRRAPSPRDLARHARAAR